jgi:hypothetical protein
MTNVKGARSDAPCKRIDRIIGGRLVVVHRKSSSTNIYCCIIGYYSNQDCPSYTKSQDTYAKNYGIFVAINFR